MLGWRLIIGTVVLATLACLSWLDFHASVPGLYLMPLGAVVVILATSETLSLVEGAGVRPVGWVVHIGNLAIFASGWAPFLIHELAPNQRVDVPAIPDIQTTAADPEILTAYSALWVVFAFAASVLAAFISEMRRFERPGGVTENLSGAIFALVYVGVLSSFLVMIRMAWGVGPLLTMICIAKMGDIGAYLVGRTLGRHKLMPTLSPGKTVEGAFGAVVFATFGSWIAFGWLLPRVDPMFVPHGSWVSWTLFGVLLGLVGMLGDLAESLMKRDCGAKDSGHWIPGFGGALDILDSVLFAAPITFGCWIFGIV